MKEKSRVKFGIVEIFHFSRCLGIDKVPERGNNPLGMESNHFNFKTIDIANQNCHDVPYLSDGDNLINIKKLCASTPKSNKTTSIRENGEEDNESIHSVMSIDYTANSLQPLNPIQRKKCLQNAGVNIGKTDDDVSRNPKILSKLREDRKQVGCKCSNAGKCNASKCICSIEGIPCQSDGNKFPCKCGDKCSNKNGKRLYSHAKIRFHYSHAINRISNSNEIIDIDTLSTLNGDCPTCSMVPEEVWKNITEPYHQTRSRKRTGENNIENVKMFKPSIFLSDEISPATGTSDLSLTNGYGDCSLSVLCLLNTHESLMNNDIIKITKESNLVNYPIITKTTSTEFCKTPTTPLMDYINKENVDISQIVYIKNTWSNNEIQSTKSKLSSDYIVNKTNTPCKSPLNIQISQSSPLSHMLPMNNYNTNNDNISSSPLMSTDLNHLSINVIDYRKSFLNNESFNDNISSPIVINLSPLKFNPISLASQVDSFTDKKSTPSNNKSFITDFINNQNESDFDYFQGTILNNSITEEARNNDKYLDEHNSMLSNTINDNNSSTSSTNQLLIENLQIITSYSSENSVASSDSDIINESKTNYSYLSNSKSSDCMLSTINNESSMNYKSKIITVANNQLPSMLTIDNVPSFRYSEEITFFDIPFNEPNANDMKMNDNDPLIDVHVLKSDKSD